MSGSLFGSRASVPMTSIRQASTSVPLVFTSSRRARAVSTWMSAVEATASFCQPSASPASVIASCGRAAPYCLSSARPRAALGDDTKLGFIGAAARVPETAASEPLVCIRTWMSPWLTGMPSTSWDSVTIVAPLRRVWVPRSTRSIAWPCRTQRSLSAVT